MKVLRLSLDYKDSYSEDLLVGLLESFENIETSADHFVEILHEGATLRIGCFREDTKEPYQKLVNFKNVQSIEISEPIEI